MVLETWAEDCTVTGITKTSNNHASIRELVGGGDRLRLALASDTAAEEKFQNVVFCAPPSGFDDYPAAVEEAAQKYWAGSEAGGVFVFTSSGAVCVGVLHNLSFRVLFGEWVHSPRVMFLLECKQLRSW